MTSRTPPAPWLWLGIVVAAALAVSGVAPAAADQSTSPRTFDGPAYSAAYATAPTRAENQSKLWFHADAWWAMLVDPTGRVLRVHELMPDHTWRPTSAVVNADVGDVGDALPDGDTVHVVTRGSDSSLLYVRLSFDAAARDYGVAPPVLVTTRKSGAPATLAKDTAGALWIGYATAQTVVVTYSLSDGQFWGRTVTLASNPVGQIPEAAGLVAFDDRIGMLWSNTAAGTFEFASHRAGDDPSIWAREVARAGPGEAGDHVSLAAVPGDPLDTLVAAVKTSHDAPGEPSTSTLLQVLIRGPDGLWSAAPVSTVADGLENPVVQVDLVTRTLHVFAARNGAIVTKTAPLDAIAFAPGPGDVFVNGTARELNDPTVPKNPVDARSGLVVLASDFRSWTYRHAEQPLSVTAVAEPGDVTPPTPPPDLRARVVSSESAVLSWEPANDGGRWVPAGTGVPVAGYIVARNGVEVATVASTTFEDQARTTGTDAVSIDYSVTAVDAAGNRSAPTAVVVELPGSEDSRTLFLSAVVLLAMAGLLVIGQVLYRWRVVRGARVPRVAPAAREERRSPAAVP